jgi:hypothetical protein
MTRVQRPSDPAPGIAAPPTLPLQIFRYTHRLIVATANASTLQQSPLHYPENTL